MKIWMVGLLLVPLAVGSLAPPPKPMLIVTEWTALGVLESIHTEGGFRLDGLDELPPMDFQLEEFNAFSAGQKFRTIYNEDWQPIGEEPFPFHSFRGHVLGHPDQDIILTISDEAIHGHVSLGQATIGVSSVRVDETLYMALELTSHPAPFPELRAPSRGSENRLLTVEENVNLISCGGDLLIQPHADIAFASTHPDWASRIASAIATHSNNLWYQEICVGVLHNSPTIISDHTNGNYECLHVLNKYREVRWDLPSVDAYQLFTGHPIYPCNGMARTVITGEDWQPGDEPVPGKMASDPSSIIRAVDHYPAYSWQYDPDLVTNHLAKASAQELAHNWGEWDHHQDYRQDPNSSTPPFNIMAQHIAGSYVGWWMIDLSAYRIMTGVDGANE